MMMMMNWINFESSLFSKFSLSPYSTSRSFSTHSSRSFFILFFCKYTSELVIIYNTVWIFKFLIRRDSEQVAKDFCGSSDVNIALIKVSPLRKRGREIRHERGRMKAKEIEWVSSLIGNRNEKLFYCNSQTHLQWYYWIIIINRDIPKHPFLKPIYYHNTLCDERCWKLIEM